MLCLVHKVTRRVRAGLFVFKAFSPSAAPLSPPPVGIWKLLVLRKLEVLQKRGRFGRNVLCACLPFYGRERGQIYTYSLGGEGGGGTLAGERAIKSFSPQDNAWFFCCFFMVTNSSGATRSPSPVPSLSRCRLAPAGGGTAEFQHLLHRTPNYYAQLLRQPSSAAPALGGAGSAPGRRLPSGRAAAQLRGGSGSPRPAQVLCSGPQRGGQPAPCRHGSTHTAELSRPHSGTPPPPPPELPESLSGVE